MQEIGHGMQETGMVELGPAGKNKGQKAIHRHCKQCQLCWKEYRHAVWLGRDGFRNVKAQLELNLAGDAKNNKNGFFNGMLAREGRLRKVCLPC